MESNTGPKRVVLRFNVQYEQEEAAINKQFFALFGPEPKNNFYSHLMAPNESSKMHIVLDIYCKSYPRVDNSKIPYEVFKVKKKDEFEFEKLNSSACQYARARCERIKWGTNRSQSEELVGDRALHAGHSPSTFVS
ncbi:hypothetical protein P154DRAFT_526055 [Amniculicola lignicola CBS 123094]|uniref:Uncharacterized protein n=1 Tax=Amniculicola lignicola CBS 123094 TaxID=1392246 RepID=A0A6A5W238_9PLEO|nr:hypothetical protein P154DRAFT_526055 [Amniculicola lignicola CBS 123094]